MKILSAARNGAAAGAAVAILRICWNWTSWEGYRLNPYWSDAQLLSVYMVGWYALAGAVIFIVARNVFASMQRR